MANNYEVLRLDWTPNPNAFKLVLNNPITKGAGLNFTNADEAKEYEMAVQLIQIKDVETIFFKDNFVTVTQVEEGKMNEIHDQAVKIIQSSACIAEEKLAVPEERENQIFTGDFDDKNDEEKIEMLDTLFDQEIRPGLAMDGGGLSILGIEGNQIKINYQGACGSCPSSSAGTLQFINNLVKTRLSPGLVVVNA